MILVPISNQSTLYFKMSLRRKTSIFNSPGVSDVSQSNYTQMVINYFYFHNRFRFITQHFKFALQSATKYRKILNDLYSTVYFD